MNIGVLGYFGFGNYGDELFLDIWEQLFQGHRIVTFHEVTGIEKCMHSTPEQRQAFVDSIDVLLIGGGDLIRPKGKINYWFPELLSKPVYLHGVGVARWLGKDPDVITTLTRFLRHDNVRQIGMRDIQSKRWLMNTAPELADKLSVSPDIAFSLPREAPKATKDTKRVGIITRHQKVYSDERIAQLQKIVTLYQDSGFQVVELLASTGQEKTWDLEGSQNWHLGIEVETFDTEQGITQAIADCDLLYSMKFHGCVAGLVHHIPSIALLKTDKFANLYKFLRLENWLVGRTIEGIRLEDASKPREALWQNIDTLTEYANGALKKLQRDISG